MNYKVLSLMPFFKKGEFECKKLSDWLNFSPDFEFFISNSKAETLSGLTNFKVSKGFLCSFWS